MERNEVVRWFAKPQSLTWSTACGHVLTWALGEVLSKGNSESAAQVLVDEMEVERSEEAVVKESPKCLHQSAARPRILCRGSRASHKLTNTSAINLRFGESSPVGHVEFVQAQLVSTTKKHTTLYERIQSVQDLQSAWLLLLFCANARATYSLRCIPPNEVAEFAAAHDAASWQCLTKLLSFPRNTDRHSVASLSFDLGGCGLQSAWRTRVPAHWASWADSLRMIHQRHPEVANTMIRNLSEGDGRHFHAAAACCDELRAVGHIPPGWRALSTAQPQDIADRLPGVLGIPAEGWQHDASSCIEKFFCDSSVLPGMSAGERALLRSQGGPLAALPYTVVPTCPLRRFDPDIFRVLLLRRLRLPLPLSSHSCRCGRPLDCLGHHRASCSRAGVLGRRGFALESAAARVCREAGARVSTNIFVRDLDVVAVRAEDQRRIEVIAEGLPVFHGSQLAIDTTLVSPVRADGEPHRQCQDMDGAALDAARRRKARTYPELTGGRGRAKLVVLAGEIGGRFSVETQTFIRLLARAKTRAIPEPLRTRARQSWMHRWGSLLACAAARAFGSSLLERRGQPGFDGVAPPAVDVLGDFTKAQGASPWV